MIVVFSPYPYEPLRQDGMYRRILEIDRLFGDELRYYVYVEPQGRDYRIREPFQVDSRTYVQLLDLQYVAHHLKLREYINRARFVYAQTMIYSTPYLAPYYASGKIITDAHGAAAEEERLVNRYSRGRWFDSLERHAANGSRAVVVVTQAMADYYRTVYGASATEFVHIPICTTFSERRNWSIPARKTVIYAGGVHKWQNVDLMLQASNRVKDEIDTVFLTNATDYVKRRMAELHCDFDAHLGSVPHEQVPEYLLRAQYGYVIRDDTPVNNVAFPTKLIEYMAYGVIPVIKSSRVGDYERMGVEGVSVDDFMAGRLPDDARLRQMMDNNYDRYRRVFDQYEAGCKRVKEIFAEFRDEAVRLVNDALALPSVYQASFIPLNVEYCYDVGGVSVSGVLDAADTPLRIELDVADETGNGVDIGNLMFAFGDKNFVFSRCVAEVSNGGTVAVLELKNASDFVTDQFGGRLYECGRHLRFLEKGQTIPCRHVSLCIEIALYGPEAHVATSGSILRRYLARFSFVRRRDGLVQALFKGVRCVLRKVGIVGKPRT